MSPSIVIRLTLAALATTLLLPAQSAPSRTSKPDQAQGQAKADEKVQTRLAEVIAMLEEDDLSPEQRAKAKKKLEEIGARLEQEAARSKAGGEASLPGTRIIRTADGPVIVESKKGVYRLAPDTRPAEVREVEGPPDVEEKVVLRRYPGAGVTVAPLPPSPDSAPSPARAPRAPRAPQAPRAMNPEAAPPAPEAAEAPPEARFVLPEAGRAGPTPPRARRTRFVESREVPVETVEESVVEVEAPVPLRWVKAKAAEAARAEAAEVQEVVRVRGQRLEEARARLEAARAHGEHGEHTRALHEAARERESDAKVRGRSDEGSRDVGERYRAKAEAARRDAADVRTRVLEVVRGDEGAKRLPARRDDEATGRQSGNGLFGRVVESRPVEAGDDEIRALIDEMRAEMRQIRALMQELRTRSDRDEETGESVGSDRSSIGATTVSDLHGGGQASGNRTSTGGDSPLRGGGSAATPSARGR